MNGSVMPRGMRALLVWRSHYRGPAIVEPYKKLIAYQGVPNPTNIDRMGPHAEGLGNGLPMSIYQKISCMKANSLFRVNTRPIW